MWQMTRGSAYPPVIKDGTYSHFKNAKHVLNQNRYIKEINLFHSIIERCLNAEPSKRFRSFKSVRLELESLLHKQTGKFMHFPGTKANMAADWNNKGMSLNALGCHDKALQYCKRALKVDPHLPSAWNNKGLYLCRRGCYEEAIQCCDRALALNPKFYPALNTKGNSLYHIGRIYEAISYFDQALEINPSFLSAWNNKTLSLVALKDFDDAIKCCDRALSIDSEYSPSLSTMATIYYLTGEYKMALKYINKSILVNPRNHLTWFNKALTEEALGDYKSAKGSWRKYLEAARLIKNEKKNVLSVELRLNELEGKQDKPKLENSS
jgi:tetratricopeptide (TPR) repeat protein